jgi:predicted DNA binding CopG/RHH family protein
MRIIVPFLEGPFRLPYFSHCPGISKGYSATMSRTVYSDRVGSESFEGLLDRLTRRASASDAVHAASEVSSAVGISDTSASSAHRRILVPVTGVKQGKVKPSNSGSMPLSYEKALRIHARRNLTSDTDLRNPEGKDTNRDIEETSRTRPGPVASSLSPRQATSLSGISSLAAPSSQIPGRGTREKGVKNNNGNHPGKREAEAAGLDNTRLTTARNVSQDSCQTPVPIPLQASALQQPQASSPKKVKRAGPQSKSARHTSAKETIAPESQNPRQVPTVSVNEITNGPAKTKASEHKPVRHAKVQRKELALKPQPVDLQLEHRHAVVSIRLNDAEIERLRQRAAESGISVSAYMRSCVLDAEQLRTQVKQALAEMRASMPSSSQTSALSTALQGEQVSFPSQLPVFFGAESGGRSAWSKLLLKSATFLLGPWFFFRHRV